MFRVNLEPDKHFAPPFENVVPRQDGSFDFYISTDLSFRIESLIMVYENEVVYTNLLELLDRVGIIKDAPRILRAKIDSFEDRKEERIRRFFAGYAKSIFFSEEEAFRLEEFFEMMFLYGDVTIMKLDNYTPIEKLTNKERDLVFFMMQKHNIVSELNPQDEAKFRDTKRVKKIMTKKSLFEKEGGVAIMNRGQLMRKAIGSTAIFAFGSFVALSGGMAMKKSLSTLFGLEKEIILVEDMPFDEPIKTSDDKTKDE